MWETRKATPKARAAITVDIAQNGDTLTGTVYLADRTGGSRRLAFSESKLSADTLSFQMPMDGETFYWSLTLGKAAKTGILKGAYNEMLIEEEVKKR